jgi:hypothetical protein
LARHQAGRRSGAPAPRCPALKLFGYLDFSVESTGQPSDGFGSDRVLAGWSPRKAIRAARVDFASAKRLKAPGQTAYDGGACSRSTGRTSRPRTHISSWAR